MAAVLVRQCSFYVGLDYCRFRVVRFFQQSLGGCCRTGVPGLIGRVIISSKQILVWIVEGLTLTSAQDGARTKL